MSLCRVLNFSLFFLYCYYHYRQYLFFFRIGTEHEKFGFEVDTLRPIKYEQIRDLLNGLAERFDWDKIMEGDYVIGLKQVIELSH